MMRLISLSSNLVNELTRYKAFATNCTVPQLYILSLKRIVSNSETKKGDFAGDFASRLGANPLVCREQTRTLSDFVRVFPAVRFNTYGG